MLVPGVQTVLGTMEFRRRASQECSAALLRAFLARGHCELETAAMYAQGKSERILGDLLPGREEEHGSVTVAAKANPWGGQRLMAEGLRAQLEASLERLQSPDVALFYLHAPDAQAVELEGVCALELLMRPGF